ncbi:hypothetical protein Agub_g8930 [Astrephomene gubernaculifera]|uniref:Uncharacterized protein n=1 Tax=Astrephomene gubernaculifera TaxID=47775 RepID=A0AAD3DSI5_9CHLO|nr:hypothetical protein Agub_g8930 [Astrephomene gubernaculifera]
MPLFKRLFGQGKSKGSSGLAALCIGDYSRVTLPIWGLDARQLESLLAHEAAEDDGSPSSPSNQPTPQATKSGTLGGQSSFKGLRHLFQHLGGGASSKEATTQADVESQRQLTQFIKQLGELSEVSFVTAAEDGLIFREKVLSKLTKLFKQSTAPVVIVSYCGPSDERGNWRLASQSASSSGLGRDSTQAGNTGAAAAGVSGSGSCHAPGSVVSFREVSMLWQRYRKHSQRLVLLLDCPNSGYWVAALRMLSKAEQLELSLGVQASDSSLPAGQGRQLVYQPGIFTQLFFFNNKWRRDPRRAAPPLAAQHQQQSTQSPGTSQHYPGGSVGGGGGGGSVNSSVRGGRMEQWLPGMMPSFYATWLNENLVDYRIALRFFNLQAPACPPGELFGLNRSVHNRSVRAPVASASTAAAAATPGTSTPDSPPDAVQVWRASTMLIATAGSAKGLGRRSRLCEAATAPAPAGDPWFTTRPSAPSPGTAATGPVEVDDVEALRHSDKLALEAAMALRAPSLPDAAGRRFSSVADYYAHTDADTLQSNTDAASRPVATTNGASALPEPPVTALQASSAFAMTHSLHRRLQLEAAQRPYNMSSPQEEAWSSGAVSQAFRAPTVPDMDVISRGVTYAGADSLSPAMSASAAPFPIFRHGTGIMSSPAGCTSGTANYVLAGTSPPSHNNQLPPRSPSSSRQLQPPPPLEQQLTQHHISLQEPQEQQEQTHGSQVLSPSSAFGAAAVRPWTASGDGDAAAAAAACTVRSNTGDLAIQTSAQSDTAAMQWDRRISRVEGGHLLVEDCMGVQGSSFSTGPTARRGFANELLGALQEVATERRLMARRAPLEGDEPLEVMMQDADIERNTSISSLPSAILPHNMLAGTSASPGPPPHSTTLLAGGGSISGRVAGGCAASSPSLATPRTSVLGMQQQLPADLLAGRQAGVTAPRQMSRLFMMSVVAAAAGEGGAAAATAGGAGGSIASLMEALESSQQSFEGVAEGELLLVGDSLPSHPQLAQQQTQQSQEQQDKTTALLQQLQRLQQPQALHGFASAGGRAATSLGGGVEGGGGCSGLNLLEEGSNGGASCSGDEGSILLHMAASLFAHPGSAAAAAAAAAMQSSPGWVPSLHSPALSPMPSSRERQRARRGSASSIMASGGGGFGSSSLMLKSLLKQHVSIADSMDLDAVAAAATPTWQRRPGRMQMAGSETSSFVFGDDRERFEMLRCMRDADGAEGCGGECDESGSEAAGARRGGADSHRDSAFLDSDMASELLLAGSCGAHAGGSAGSSLLAAHSGGGGYACHALAAASETADSTLAGVVVPTDGSALLLTMGSNAGVERSDFGANQGGKEAGREDVQGGFLQVRGFEVEGDAGEGVPVASDAVIREGDVRVTLA